MHTHLHLGPERIDEAALAAGRVGLRREGAVVLFLGVVRDEEAGKPIRGIEYEAFDRMARHQFGMLFETAAKRWPLASVRLVHRTGFVAAGDASLWLEVIAPHRGEALDACRWIIDRMKAVVPIWKRPVAPAETGIPGDSI